jgi:DNA-binding NarL/FixJ family response regulator
VRPDPSEVVAYVCHPDSRVAQDLACLVVRAGVVGDACAVEHAGEIPSDAVLAMTVVYGVDRTISDLRVLRERLQRAVLVVACDGPTVRNVVALMRGGADAVVDLDAGDDAIVHGVRAALTNGSYVPAHLQAPVALQLLRRRRDGAKQRARIASLTPQEMGLLRRLAAGETREMIARRNGEPLHGVRVRIDRAKAKLGVTSQRQAVVLLTEHLPKQS